MNKLFLLCLTIALAVIPSLAHNISYHAIITGCGDGIIKMETHDGAKMVHFHNSTAIIMINNTHYINVNLAEVHSISKNKTFFVDILPIHLR